MNRPAPPGPDPKDFGTLIARLVAVADDAVIVTDARQQIVFFNDSAERVFGRGWQSVLGKPLAILLPESRRAAHEEHMRRFAASNQPARGKAERAEVQGQRADGSLFEAEASIAQIAWDGKTYFAAILRDVSEARQAARALRRSEARFRELAATVPVGIFQTDASGACVYVNERWCSMAGLCEAEAMGAGWQRGLHPSDRTRVSGALQAAIQERAPFEGEFRFVRRDGAETWVMARALASRDADGGFSGYLGTVTDVTERHAQAQALELARSEAEAAARTKSLFLANMSHEIRTPLNAVIGMTTLLLDTEMSEDQREMARTIRTSSETLLEIINDILDYSKVEVGKLEIEQQVFDLRRCVEESLDMVSPRALEKRLNLAYLIEEETPEALVGDVARIRQILINLLSNAVKFTHQGEVFVAVDSEALDDGLQRVRFAVHDSGIGIQAEHLPRLFQSYSQVDASTTRKYGGTGLGLAISRRLAELMGGTVTARSEPGQGSVFEATVVARPAEVAPPEYLQQNAPALVGKRLLIVDDNLTNRRILTRMALRWGMVPSTLPSAVEALDRLRHGECFDVAVLDMRMPGINGLDLAVEIRRRRGPEELPIVILTSLGQRRALEEHDSIGLSAFLPKPIKACQLFAALVTAVRGGRLAPVAAAPRPAIGLPMPADAPALKLLVAEDNQINQRVATRLLQGLGFRADVAANGLEVIEAVERQSYDVVLMDIQMPEMDGLQAAEWIVRRRGPGGLPRLIAMTANAMPGDRSRYLAAGMDAYVAKPIEVGELSAALAQAMAPRGAAGGGGDVADSDADDESVLETARLDHLRLMQRDGEPSLVRELIDLFVADTPGHLGALAKALDAADAKHLARVAHRLLSVTQNIGAHRMSSLCIEIEGLSRQGRLESVRPLIAGLDREHVRVQVALLALRAQY